MEAAGESRFDQLAETKHFLPVEPDCCPDLTE